MEMIFLTAVFLLGGFWVTEAMSEAGVLGKEIKIKCSHSNAFSNVKYFCKGACNNEDILISSRQKKNDSNEKYQITDVGNTFYVTIFHLTKDDSGNTEANNDSDFSQSVSNEANHTKSSSSKKLLHIGAGLGVALLALATGLLIFFKHRSRDISASSGKVQDAICATPSNPKQDAHHTTMSSSTANNDQETTGGNSGTFSSSCVQHQDASRDHSDSSYSNVIVSPESQIQPGGPLYTTVSFNKHTDCSTVTPCTAAAVYSTIELVNR